MSSLPSRHFVALDSETNDNSRTRTVLIAGSTGFVGRNIARALLERGMTVLAQVRIGSDTSVLPPGCQVLYVDGETNCAAAWHTAAPSGIDAVVNAAVSYGRNGATDEVGLCNVELPLGWLRASIALGCRSFVQLDTFFSRAGLVHDYLPEYTDSKRQFLRIASGELTDTALTLFNARLEHVYGPGDDPAKFVPWLLGALLRGQATVALTPCLHNRDFVHVHDVASAVATLLASGIRHPGVIQEVAIGSGQAMSVRDFATCARRVANANSLLDFGALAPSQREIFMSCADLGYLHALGWSPTIDLTTGLAGVLDTMRSKV